ncbi:zf-CCHC domain-containing protein [Tanacetum coccineum]
MAAAEAAGEEKKRRVEARGIMDRVDPVKRSIFGVGRKTRRKSFPAAGDGDGSGRVVAGGCRKIWGRESCIRELATWMIGQVTQLMDASGLWYQGSDASFVGSSEVMAIEESKDLTSLSLDELIGNLKVYELIIKKDSKIVKAKGERKSLTLKAKKESSDEKSSTFGSEDEEYAMATFQRSRDDKNGKSDRKCFRCGDPNHLIRECPKPPKEKNQREFVGGSWSDGGEEDDKKDKDKTCFMAQASSECTRSDGVSWHRYAISSLMDTAYRMSEQ